MATNPLTNKEYENLFAAALNEAQHNLYMSIRHISAFLGLNADKVDEESLESSELIGLLNNKGRKEQKQKAMDLLDDNFPFLKPFLDKVQKEKKEKKINNITVKEYYEVMVMLIKVLMAYRNEFTHYAPIGIWTDDLHRQFNLLIKCLRNAFTGGCREVKSRLNLPADCYTFIESDNDGEQYVKGSKGKKIRDEWFYKLDVKELDNSKKIVKYTDAEGKERTLYRLSKVGLVMFISLFLQKQKIIQLISSVKMHKDRVKSNNSTDIENEKRIVNEIFCVYRQKLTRERIESTRQKYAIALDMLNELQKCPRELMKTLHPDAQNLFRVTTDKTEEQKRVEKQENDGEESDDMWENFMMRYKDRFPYLAMSYIDTFDVLPGVFFQVALGKYRFKFYEKDCIDGERRVRSWQKELNGFGRLTKIETERKNLYKPSDYLVYIEDQANTEPYVTNQRAAYKITGNRVGLMFNTKEKQTLKNDMYLPGINPPKGKSEGNEAKEEYKAKEVLCEQPTCWLSVYELPALLFHHLLSNDKNTTAGIIRDCVTNLRQLFYDIVWGASDNAENCPKWLEEQQWKQVLEHSSKERSAGVIPVDTEDEYKELIKKYNLKPEWIPLEIRDYLLKKEKTHLKFGGVSYSSFKFKKQGVNNWHDTNALSETEKLLADFEIALARVGTSDNKIGKKSYKTLNPGEIAMWLAKDILKLQPSAPANGGKPKGHNKLTGLNFAVFQAAIATYNGNISELKNLFGKTGLIEGDYSHPFLQDVLNEIEKGDILTFYKEYLEKRKNYFGVQRPKQNNSSLPDRVKWMERNKTWYCKLAYRYLASPIELPRGLFKDAIVQLLPNSNFKEMFNVQISKYNVSYLVTQYHKFINKDSNQEFYYTGEASCDATINYNVSYLITQYHKFINKDSNQEFYYTGEASSDATINYKRNYLLFELLKAEESDDSQPLYLTLEEMLINDETMPKLDKNESYNDFVTLSENTKKTLTEEEKKEYEEKQYKKKLMKAKRHYFENERSIRRYMVQDIIMFMIAKKILSDGQKQNEKANDFKLENIRPGVSEGILSENINNFSIVLLFKYFKKDKDGKITEERECNDIIVEIYQDSIKYKNLGDFFKFIYDSRLRSLVVHLKGEEIKKENLEEKVQGFDLDTAFLSDKVKYMKISSENLAIEFETYEKARPGIFESVHLLERNVIANNGGEDKLKSRTFTNKQGKELPILCNFNELMKLDDKLDDKSREILVELRNAFSHSRYPQVWNSDSEKEQLELPKVAETAEKMMNEYTSKEQ